MEMYERKLNSFNVSPVASVLIIFDNVNAMFILGCHFLQHDDFFCDDNRRFPLK